MASKPEDKGDYTAVKDRTACGVCLLTTALLLCSCATTPRPSAVRSGPQRPAEVTINKDAGRGDLLVITRRLEDGDPLPVVVDTGAPRLLLDKSLEPRLGKCLGAATLCNWGDRYEGSVYAAPKVYLGQTPLVTRDVMTAARAAAGSALKPARKLLRNGQLPGWSKKDRGGIQGMFRYRPDPDTVTFPARKKGDPSTYHYRFTRASKGSPWQLQKAWRTDQNGRVMEEYPVP